MADMGQERNPFKTVSHIHLLTVSDNKSIFFGSKMDQTKHKPFRMRDFCKFSVRNSSLHLEHIFLKKIATSSKTLLCTLNIQILKFLKVKNEM